VIRQGVETLRAEVGRRLLDALTAQGVDDARRALGLRPDELDELATRIDLGVDAVLDVGAVEAGDEPAGVAQAQTLDDLLGGGRGGRRRERHARDVGEAVGEVAEGEVVGPEVVAPLRHAVRFVDGDDAEATASEKREGLRTVQPLGGDVQQVEFSGEVGLLDGLPLGGRLCRVEVARANAVGDQGLYLVVHERDQRADHETGARPHERGHLVRDALAAAGRHEHDGVSAADHVLHDLGLVAAEGVVPVDLVQDLARVATREVADGGELSCGAGDRGGTSE